MDFMGSGRWPEANGPNAAAAAAAAAAAWAMTEQYILPAGTVQHGAVFIPMKTCARKRPTDVEEADNQALPSFSEVRQSTTSRAKRRKEVLNVESEGCTYSGAFYKDTLTGFGSIVYPQGDRFGPPPAPAASMARGEPRAAGTQGRSQTGSPRAAATCSGPAATGLTPTPRPRAPGPRRAVERDGATAPGTRAGLCADRRAAAGPSSRLPTASASRSAAAFFSCRPNAPAPTFPAPPIPPRPVRN